MIVLGINAFGYNPSACLVRDGKLTAFCQEERFSRLKGSHGMFPSLTVSWCLSSQNLVLGDVDLIALSWGCEKYPWKMIAHLIKMRVSVPRRDTFSYKSNNNQKGNLISSMEYIYRFSPKVVMGNIRDSLRLFGHKGPIPPIEFVDHHLSHAYQAFYQSPFPEASVLIVDGSGEEYSINGYSFDENGYHKILSYELPQSLGWYYSGFTAYLGFKPIRDEGKLMGLAAYGEKRKENNRWIEIIDKILKTTGDGFELDPTYFKFGGNEYHPRYTDKLVRLIISHNADLYPVSVNEFVSQNGRKFNRYLLDDYIDLAYAVQTRLEQAMASLVNNLIKKTGIGDLCLAGGVAMNCKANGHIFRNTEIDDIFIHPASSDDGSCIGAALYVSGERGYNPRNVLENVQLGPSYSSAEIEEAIKACNLSYSTPENICKVVAGLINDGKIVGWFMGGCEMGARALGGRSIVASPATKDIKSRLNSNIKRREQWRPYCPSVNSEYRDDYQMGSGETPFMILAGLASEKLLKAAPDTVHVDGTVRSQTVNKAILPRWHSLIEYLQELNGHPVILNTSLNVRGEPIACRPQDAIGYLFTTGMDALAIENYLITKS